MNEPTFSTENEVQRLQFLSRLPLLLNSTLEVRRVLKLALEHLTRELHAEAASIFLLNDNGEELEFWALQGGEETHLEGKRMPADRGIVGWVIQKQLGALVNDVTKDPRYFDVESHNGFQSRAVICTPLTVRGNKRLGAIEVLNKIGGLPFEQHDLLFLEQCASYLALAIENAKLYQIAKLQNHRLQTLDQKKNDLITVLIHEFNTPLNIIRSAGELLSLPKQEADVRTKINTMLGSAIDRLSRLISEVRNVSFATRDLFAVTLQSIPVRELFETVALQFEDVCRKRGLTFSIQIGTRVENLEGDYALLTIVLHNLIGNAIRFTPDGGAISLLAERALDLIQIRVVDSGIGIPDTEFEAIFEKFHQLSDALYHSSGTYEFKSGGLGLGLATVAAILRAHKSSISVSSQVGKGSTFQFSLRPAV